MTTMTRKPERVLFADVKVGDVVVQSDGLGGRLRRVTVDKVTSKEVVSNGIRYRRDNGRGIGDSYGRRIKVATPELLAEVERQDEAEAADAARRARVAARESMPDWQAASTILGLGESDLIRRLGPERLAQVAAWLAETE
jgi:hypothetical protein